MERTIQNIPFLRITIALIFGIILGTNFVLNSIFILVLSSVLLGLLISVNSKYKYSFGIFYGITIQLFFICVGAFVAIQYNKKPVFVEKGNFEAVILEVPLEKAKSYKSVLQIKSLIDSDSAFISNEKIIAYFEKNEKVRYLIPGDVILFNSKPNEINNYNNPYEFNYKRFLERKRIYRQVYIPQNRWVKTNITSNNLKTHAEKIRESLLEIYRNQNINETEFEILSALTLGYKRDIDPETRRVFIAAGASHILAVSGLHVGIVYWVIFLFFGFLRKSKYGRLCFMIISISILWLYAFVTGLSPSVMRAATMFSLFVVGENLSRKSNIYNSLAASAFILLLINPNNLFEVGFQLSYSAVFGIVFLQPKFQKLMVVKPKILKFFWTLLTISIAAQIATAPVSIYYFGQFPSYFWITNTFMVPAAMCLIPMGFSLLIFSKFQFLANIISEIINLILKLIYTLLLGIEQLPSSVLYVSVNRIQFLFFVAILISIFLILHQSKVRYIKSVFVFSFLFIISVLIQSVIIFNNTEFIAYNTPKNQSIHLIRGKNNYVISEKPIPIEEKYFHPAIKTSRKLGLKQPVFLKATDSIINNEIFIKNNYAFFEGKTFSFNKELSASESKKIPDFNINPIINKTDSLANLGSITISNKRSYKYIDNSSANIHNTLYKGAFRKKW